MRRNPPKPADRVRERRARGREVYTATIVAVRGPNITELLDQECGDAFDAGGPTGLGPGSSVTTIRPLDGQGRQRPRSVQILPAAPPIAGGSASFVDTRRVEIDSAPSLTAADPQEIPAGETTEVTFIGLGLVEDPLTPIVAVLASDRDQDDPRVTIENAAWVADPQAGGIAPGFSAITADVTVAGDAVPGTLIYYAVEV